MGLWMPQVAGIRNYKAAAGLEPWRTGLLVSEAKNLILCRPMLTLEYLAELLDKHRADAALPVKEFAIGGRPFPFNTRPAIMGVVNLSADSWYRESVCLTTEMAIRRGRVLHEQGAEHCRYWCGIDAGARGADR